MQVARACVSRSRKCYTTSCCLCNKGTAWPSSSGTWEASSCDGNQQGRSKTHDTSWKRVSSQPWLSAMRKLWEITEWCWGEAELLNSGSLDFTATWKCSAYLVNHTDSRYWTEDIICLEQGSTWKEHNRALKHTASHRCFFQEWRPVFRL